MATDVAVCSVTVAGSTIEIDSETTVLNSLLRAGVWMPNSCNQGTCGTCKIRVISGEIVHDTPPSDACTEAERGTGLALACQARPRGDVVVESTSDKSAGRADHPLRSLTAAVESVTDIANDTRRIVLRLPEPLAFDAGQHVEITVPGTDVRRQYSLANTSTENKALELHVKRVPGGIASEAWGFGTIAVGEEVQVSGPFGDFRLPSSDDGEAPMVMLAGGTGLAPLIGIAREALARSPERQIRIYHGVRSAADLYDRTRLERLAADHPGVTYVAVTSREPAVGDIRSGYAQDAFCEDVAFARGWTGWLCGPPAMVEAGVKALKRRRLAPRLTFREKFTAPEI